MSAQDSSLPNIAVKSVSIDENAALELLDGSRVLLKELAVMFVEDAPAALDDLREAVEADNQVEARRAVHSLKGLASTFFAKPTVELAQRLEDAAASGNILELSDGGVEELSDSIQVLCQALKLSGLVD